MCSGARKPGAHSGSCRSRRRVTATRTSAVPGVQPSALLPALSALRQRRQQTAACLLAAIHTAASFAPGSSRHRSGRRHENKEGCAFQTNHHRLAAARGSGSDPPWRKSCWWRCWCLDWFALRGQRQTRRPSRSCRASRQRATKSFPARSVVGKLEAGAVRACRRVPIARMHLCKGRNDYLLPPWWPAQAGGCSSRSNARSRKQGATPSCAVFLIMLGVPSAAAALRVAGARGAARCGSSRGCPQTDARTAPHTHCRQAPRPRPFHPSTSSANSTPSPLPSSDVDTVGNGRSAIHTYRKLTTAPTPSAVCTLHCRWRRDEVRNQRDCRIP